MVALCESAPLVPVMVIVARANAEAEYVSVSVDYDVAGFGENEPFAPGGSPLTVRVTGSEKPLLGVIVTLYVTRPPVPR